MFKYTIEIISKAINGALLGSINDSEIKGLLIDSRKITYTDGVLFFAIKGERQNGHHFIAELYDKGIRNFVVSESVELNRFSEANFIVVSNVLSSLQKLAEFHRVKFTFPVIGITGSNGKTVVKEWLYQLLKDDLSVVRSPKSFNSQVGVPLSIWQIKEGDTIGLFEAGISKPDEMKILEKIIKPNIGIIVNIGEAHALGFSSINQKAEEKLKLFLNCEKLIYCRDYSVIEEEVIRTANQDMKLFTWSRKLKADLQIVQIKKDEFQTTIQGLFHNKVVEIKPPFTDDASIENAITCWVFMLSMDYSNDIISQRITRLIPIEMRLELKEGINNCSIINDTYNSDLNSLNIALDFLNQQKLHPQKTLILSDILQSGREERDLYGIVADMIANKGITRLIGIGKSISKHSHLFQCQKFFYIDTAEFLNQVDLTFFKDETILLKGARVFGFEKIDKILQQKAHETVLEVNLNALVHNLNYFRSKVVKSDGKDAKIMAMVKAFSYGSGGYEIASVLQYHRVDYLTVAYADEGIELRRAGINLPIMVMNPEEQGFDSMIYFNLEPEIYSFRVLNMLEEAIKRHSFSLIKPVSVHLKIDTGMHRLGFEPNDINELIERLKANKYIKIESVFSHLSSSDESMHDVFTKGQICTFVEVSDLISSHFNYKIFRHILNSAGIIRFPEAHFDMVRLGIGLYGIAHDVKEQNQLQNVSSLKTTISQIKLIKEGDTIGYSRSGFANRTLQIATIPIGYADGLSRKLGNGKGKMMVNGKVAPIIGNVCMDMCMLDITGIGAVEGDEVIVFDENHTVLKMAEASETIPYEILTSISRRVKRIYFQE